MISTTPPSVSPPRPPRAPRWPAAVAAAAAVTAGVLAAQNTAWAVGIGTAAALFAAAYEVIRR